MKNREIFLEPDDFYHYLIKSSNLTETNYIGFQESIPFVDSSGSAITMTGAWSFFLDIEDYGGSSSNPGSFFCRFSGYGTSNYIKRNPSSTFPMSHEFLLPLTQ